MTDAELELLAGEIRDFVDERVANLKAELLERITDLETKATSLETRASRHAEHLRKIEDWKQGQR